MMAHDAPTPQPWLALFNGALVASLSRLHSKKQVPKLDKLDSLFAAQEGALEKASNVVETCHHWEYHLLMTSPRPMLVTGYTNTNSNQLLDDLFICGWSVGITGSLAVGI